MEIEGKIILKKKNWVHKQNLKKEIHRIHIHNTKIERM